ncbi:MAG: hypothetical protein IAG10_00870 [Planctomycetaceae bacterium]|nr:hypothetical protein [Planctomycetaceae bacterium]
MKRPIAIGRIVGLLVAAAGVVAACQWAHDATRMNAEFHQWFDDRPVDAAVDLSQPGEFHTAFRQTCSSSHGEVLQLQVNPPLQLDGNPEELLCDLSGECVITSSDGKVVEKAKFDATRFHTWAMSPDIVLTGFAPFAKGEYVVNVRIDSGADFLAGKEQRLFARYQLCGLEQFPAFIAGAFSFAAGIVALISGVCVLPGLLAQGIHAETDEDHGSLASKSQNLQ